jgi:hypothetical protein
MAAAGDVAIVNHPRYPWDPNVVNLRARIWGSFTLLFSFILFPIYVFQLARILRHERILWRKMQAQMEALELLEEMLAGPS